MFCAIFIFQTRSSTILNMGFVFIISFYDECFYSLKIAKDDYKAFSIQHNKNVLAFVNDTLANFKRTGMLLEYCYLFIFVIFFIFLLVIFYVARTTKPIIFTFDINRSSKDVHDTVKSNGISIVKQNSEVVTLDLLNEKLTFLFDAVIVFDYLSKGLIVYRNNEVQKVVVKEVNRYIQIVYNPNVKRWIAH